MSIVRLDSCRALLFVPATRPDRADKALVSGADGIVIDLEDAVAAAHKDAARGQALEWLARRPAQRETAVGLRINSLGTRAGLQDLASLAEARCPCDFVMLPKLESAFEVQLHARHLGDVALLCMIETAAGLEEAMRIATAGRGVAALGFGGLDLSVDLRAKFAWEPLLFGRSRVVQAASAAGIAVFDVPYLDLRDDAGLAGECARARAMGFTGKVAIHPSHLPAILAAFTPSAQEANDARGILQSFERSGGNVCEYQGKMVDEPVARAARRVVELAARLQGAGR